MNALYLATRMTLYAIEVGALAATINGIVNTSTTSLFAGILLYITMRAFGEKQRDDKVKKEIYNKINYLGGPDEKSDENMWLLFQLLLVIAMILLATL